MKLKREMSETAPSAPDTDEKKSRGLGSYVLWTFVAVMVYVLSSGPALLLEKKYLALEQAIDTIYAPLRWAYEHTPLHKPIGMYVHLWCPKDADKSGEIK